jgi:hypothetical protein
MKTNLTFTLSSGRKGTIQLPVDFYNPIPVIYDCLEAILWQDGNLRVSILSIEPTSEVYKSRLSKRVLNRLSCLPHPKS